MIKSTFNNIILIGGILIFLEEYYKGEREKGEKHSKK
jgi:hypothetical protein